MQLKETFNYSSLFILNSSQNKGTQNLYVTMISSTVFFTWFPFSIAKSMLLSNQPHFNYKLYQVVIIMGFWLYRKKGEKRQQELK